MISAVPHIAKFILLGDFNARIGTNHQTWEEVIGTEGVGTFNSNGLLLLRKCAEPELLITNTVFRLPTRRKRSWPKHWHLIDCTIVRKKDRQYVRVTKTMCGADCRTDNRLVFSKHTVHLACTTTTSQKSAREIGCLQAEIRQQEASIRHWYL